MRKKNNFIFKMFILLDQHPAYANREAGYKLIVTLLVACSIAVIIYRLVLLSFTS